MRATQSTQTLPKPKLWAATLQGQVMFRTWLKARTLAAYRAVTGNDKAIIPRKRRRKARSRIPTKDDRGDER